MVHIRPKAQPMSSNDVQARSFDRQSLETPRAGVSPSVGQSENHDGSYLDLFSTSQTNGCSDVLTRCHNNAPYIAWRNGESNAWSVIQGNCHDWTCPKCGPGRARREYGRIVHGAEELAAGHDLWFLTITTRGGGLSVRDAKQGYYKWTNRLLTALRKDARKRGVSWHYVQVTEWQQRGHPHSHLITTYSPDDIREGKQRKYHVKNDGTRGWHYEPCLLSDYLLERVKSAGLGQMYNISAVRSAAAASRYVAKYMFKASMFSQQYPKHWKRVRYSRSWPQLPELGNAETMVLLGLDDWARLANRAVVLRPQDRDALLSIVARLRGWDGVLDTSRVERAG